MKVRDYKTAERLGLSAQLEQLLQDVKKLDRVEAVDADLDSFNFGISEVILSPKCQPADDEHPDQSSLLHRILEVAEHNGLRRTGAPIEQDGSSYYIPLQPKDKTVWQIAA
ncbi:MAG: hypothetical protein IJT34_05535 [Butyrivibrio sp.]|nr:hypothetical protein [Butyrivibrio sp.]